MAAILDSANNRTLYIDTEVAPLTSAYGKMRADFIMGTPGSADKVFMTFDVFRSEADRTANKNPSKSFDRSVKSTDGTWAAHFGANLTQTNANAMVGKKSRDLLVHQAYGWWFAQADTGDLFVAAHWIQES
jgi:hypothetical protein